MRDERQQAVYSAWKTLRNALRMYDLNDSLATIRWYFVRRHSSRSFDTPDDLEPHPWVDKDNSFLPFEMETLAREVIISSSQNPRPRYSMRTIRGISLAMNKMKAIDTVIAEQYIDQSNIYREVTVRLAHRQFKYQTERPNMTNLIRYSKIFSNPRVEGYVIQETGLSTKQVYTIGSALWAKFEENFSLTIAGLISQLPGITNDDIRTFLTHFAKSLLEMKNLLSDSDEHCIDERFFYAYHSMYKYPLMTTNNLGTEVLICPLPTLLVWRFTSGLYYDLVHINTFGSEFGLSYEEYIGEMLSATVQGTNTEVHAGEPNLPNSPARCDWILDTPTDALLVETKTKRLSMGARTGIMSTTELDQQLDVLAKAVLQAYKSLRAYRDGSYRNPTFTLPGGKKVYVAVVTLERWYLMGNQIFQLNELIKQKLHDERTPLSILADSPYCILSSDDIERVSYLTKTLAISDIIQPYIDGWRSTYSGHEFGLYLGSHLKTYLEEYEYVFINDTDNIFTLPMPSDL